MKIDVSIINEKFKVILQQLFGICGQADKQELEINLTTILKIASAILQVSGIAKRFANKDSIQQTLCGHPLEYSTQSLFLVYYIMILKKNHSFRSLAEFMHNNSSLYAVCGLKQAPSHDTLRRRLSKLGYEFQEAIKLMGDLFLQAIIVKPRYLAADSKLFWAPKFDKQAKFTIGSKGWVRGYSLTLVCVATPNNIPIPLLAKAHSNAIPSFKILGNLMRDIPENTKFVLCDSGYDFEKVYKAIERFDDNNNVIRKAVVAPRQGRKMNPERNRRLKFFRSTRGKKIFARRLPSVELAFARLVKQLGITRCCFTNQKHNLAYLNLSVLVYNCLVYTNHMLGLKSITKLRRLLNII